MPRETGNLTSQGSQPSDLDEMIQKEEDHGGVEPGSRGPEEEFETTEDHVPFCSLKNLLVALPNIITPFTYGYQINIVGVYNQLYEYATDCSKFKADKSCTTLSAKDCIWQADPSGAMTCQWGNGKPTCTLAYGTNQALCGGDSECAWNYNDAICKNKVGYTSTYKGLFAGSMIIGCLIGSLGGGILTRKLNYRLTFIIIAVINLIGCILVHVATGIFEYWLLFVARIITGFPMGWQAVAAPMYVTEFAHPQWQQMLGTLFQVFTAFGQFINAVIGIALGNSISYSANSNQNLMGRMQGFVCFPTFFSFLILAMVLTLKQSKIGQKSKSEEEGSNSPRDADEAPKSGEKSKKKADEDNEDQERVVERPYNMAQMGFLMLIGFCMAVTLQFTGINAVMNYAPTIMGNLGLDPLVGNIIVMAFNSASAFGVIFLTRWFTLRTLHLVTLIIGSCACVFLCGVPVYPGVTKVKTAKNVVAIIGIAIFLIAYECGWGPAFFVLAGDLFPKKFRPIGQSVTVTLMFICNVMINIFYPIATEKISGGPGGNQDKGQAIAFIFFGGIGFVTLVVEFFFMRPWYRKVEPDAQGGQELDDIPQERV